MYCPTFQTPAPIMNRGEASTNPDLLIAAMIVVLMKLVYRLDDVFEMLADLLTVQDNSSCSLSLHLVSFATDSSPWWQIPLINPL